MQNLEERISEKKDAIYFTFIYLLSCPEIPVTI
jgi:hypothetical protein